MFRTFTVASVLGVAGLVLTGLFGFEEPNGTLLLVSVVLTVAAPVAVLVHLSATGELTRDEKRAWLRALVTSRGSAFSAYIASSDRRAVVQRFQDGNEDSAPR